MYIVDMSAAISIPPKPQPHASPPWVKLRGMAKPSARLWMDADNVGRKCPPYPFPP